MLLATPLQTAYVTRDIEWACTALSEKFGVTEFLRTGAVTVTTDAGEDMVLSLAHAWVDDVWLELIEPVGGAVALYRDWLPAEGAGLRLHHLGYRVESLDALRQTMHECEAAGLQTVFSITRGPPSNVFYADTAAELGHYLEYIHIPDIARATIARMPRNDGAALPRR